MAVPSVKREGIPEELWDEMFPAERNRLMHLLLKKVTLYEDHLDLELRTAGMQQLLEELDYEDRD